MLDSVTLVFGYKGYTLREKLKYPQGLSFSNKYLWNDVLHANLIKQVPELQLPVYIFQGKHDYQVSYVVAKDGEFFFCDHCGFTQIPFVSEQTLQPEKEPDQHMGF